MREGEQHGNTAAAVRLTELLREQEAAERPPLNQAARESAERFERDAAVLAEQARAEFEGIRTRWAGDSDEPLELFGSGLLHIFGPDRNETGNTSYYQHEFTWRDEGYVGASHRSGNIFANNATTAVPRWSVAQVGVDLTPKLPSCRLSIRPHVYWVGFDALAHGAHDLDFFEQRVAGSLGSTGIFVESWKGDGSDYRAGVPFWKDEWARSQANPSSSLVYEGTSGGFNGLHLEIGALGSRRYRIWVCCRVHVSADRGHWVSTSAAAGIDCRVPFLVVEEIPA